MTHAATVASDSAASSVSRRLALGYLISAAVATLYLASYSPHWYPTPDSALYLMLADNLNAGQGYTLWGYPHVHVPPGFAWLLAGADRLGLGSIAWLNVAMIASGLAALEVVRRAVNLLSDAQLAWGVMVILALSSTMHRYTLCILTDVPTMLAAWIGLWCYLRAAAGRLRGLELGTLALACCPWLRIAVIPLVVAAAVGLLIECRRQRSLRVWANALGLLVIVLATAAGFYWHHQQMVRSFDLPSYASFAGGAGDRSQWEWLWQPIHNFLFTGSRISKLLSGQGHESLGWLMGLMWIPVLVGMKVAAGRGQVIGVLVLMAYVVPIVLVRSLLARYLLPVAPLVIFFFLTGIQQLVERRAVWQGRGRTVVLVCVAALAAMNLPKCVKLAVRRHIDHNPAVAGQVADLYATAHTLRGQSRPNDLFVSPAGHRELAYLSGVATIPKADRYLRKGRVDLKGLRFWQTKGVRWLVIPQHLESKRRQQLQALSAQGGFQPVYESDSYRVYAVP